MNLDSYESWGRYPKYKPSGVIKLSWRSDIPDLSKFDKPLLTYAYGKSYGDSCLNDNGILIDSRALNHIISFDPNSGIISCESGVTLAEVLEFGIPRGWFLASTPGTKFISVGGALANDVHGKNHHKGGTFGCHVTRFELLRSNGDRLICSPKENADLYSATIGGLGLTGFITWVEFRLKPCSSPMIDMESIKFSSLDEFFDINDDSDKDFDYTVSWIDCTTSGSSLGRGLYSRGNHFDGAFKANIKSLIAPKPFPLEAPFINPLSVKAFNSLYYNKQVDRITKGLIHYDKFFYPLDAVDKWNKAYGRGGFLQYQFVVPHDNGKESIEEMLRYVSKSGKSSFLTVLKTFGSVKSPGMLSFPRPGITMAIDFRMDGQETLRLLDELDNIVRLAGGGHYPAKDARMAPQDFWRYYDRAGEFTKYIDPKFSSSFWRRMN